MHKNQLLFIASALICVQSAHGSEQEETKKKAAVAELEQKTGKEKVTAIAERAIAVRALIDQSCP